MLWKPPDRVLGRPVRWAILAIVLVDLTTQEAVSLAVLDGPTALEVILVGVLDDPTA